MEKAIKDLYRKYKRIQELEWIKSQREGPTGIGYTFEQLINKEEENFPIADYKGIEIKTIRLYSKKKIHLFNLTPDGDYLFPIRRILDNLGYPDKDKRDCKVFNMSVNAKEFTKIGFFKKMILYVNKRDRKIELVAFKHNSNINIGISWSFDELEKRLSLKLNYLFLIETLSKKIDNDEYFYYKFGKFYKLKDFEDFINLIELGIISITFKIGVYKSGDKIGKVHDRGTDFSIEEKNLHLLYEPYYLYSKSNK